ncbi:DUF5711 family protein [Siminovitchia sp. FSL H7-0308]|uniref:TolB protein n=1 Tax=Siminovitchia thermophila TaxID=1245522 RepID=A0ABS2R645_9BACI|nr:DUF5711 family protein [Siminovitchia thermophila]MBM7714845.1 TolB protein [Siminovitchia thermophila]ONK21730.1 hypothetical protein BLX87_19760 [Bacillus sp. VT-16-64]
MKRRKWLWIFVTIVIILTLALIVIGLLFGKDEKEKQNGLSGDFDISKQGTIAYVHYLQGKPEIHLYNPEQSLKMKALELENDQIIVDPSFSNDGSTLVYIAANKDSDEKLASTVYQYDLEKKEVKELFSVQSAITEIEFSPTGTSLFYLQAEVFKNYSPIASKRPHDFDLHEYRFADKKQMKHTNLKKYSMESLTIAQDGKSVFVQMPDDEDVNTAEGSFESFQRIFQIPLDQPTNLKVVSNPERKNDIYDFTVVPNKNEFIFQSVSNPDTGETFQYELYTYNAETKEEKQLTNLKEYTEGPEIAPGNKIYFMVDKRFGQRNSDYHLYQMNLDGTNITEIPLPNDK